MKFRSFVGAKTLAGEIVLNGPDIIKFVPSNKTTKKLKLGFLALVHGNEIIGLPILNTIIDGLLSGIFQPDYEILFGLGNLQALSANKRFIQKDLNRCFGQTTFETSEDQRAREIEKYFLDEIDYLVDLHQTVHPSATPFFIFQYTSAACFSHLSLINSNYPTVLQFDAIGDSQSLSTDEYLRGRGKFGVALELGQIGYDENKFKTGLTVCARFIEKLKRLEYFEQIKPKTIQSFEYPLFEITDRLIANEDNSVLDKNWHNFSKFSQGQIMGSSSGGPILSPQAGCVLFPKLNQTISKGQNLFFICSELHYERLNELNLHSNFHPNLISP